MLAACSPQTQAPAQNLALNEPAPAPDAAQQPQFDVLGQQPQKGLKDVPLTISSKNGKHAFTVEVAATPQQQETGMMFRTAVAPDRGMIFPYDPPQQVAFWMKNTLIPLDIVYIDAKGRIARITHGEPLNLDPLPSGVPVTCVLEIGGGRAAQLGIQEGDAVSWSQ